MTKHAILNPVDYIAPLNINGLEGRMLHLPAPSGRQREILLVYGLHSSLERWWGIAECFNKYGAVTMPDLPGFGGMDSFYTIGKTATVDDFADYLASFVKLRYRRKKVTIIGMSLGFVYCTRMLQKYPELHAKVELLVSLAGFAHHDDLQRSNLSVAVVSRLAAGCSGRLPAKLFRVGLLNSVVLRHLYARTANSKRRLQVLDAEERQAALDFETRLWRLADTRTYLKSIAEILRLDNCRSRVALPVCHVGISGDQYFNQHRVEQHLRIIFDDYALVGLLDLPSHAPTLVADARAAAPYLPPKLRRMLSKH